MLRQAGAGVENHVETAEEGVAQRPILGQIRDNTSKPFGTLK